MSRKAAKHASAKHVRIEDGASFRLADHDSGDKTGLDRKEAEDRTDAIRERLIELQARLYAANGPSVLVVLQGMDTSGKDGTIAHVMSGLNPQGVSVVSFKQPGPVEQAHGFLWRIHQAAPARGRIVIFNRSHYEDVLVTRVHPQLLGHQHLAADPASEEFWQHRYEDIVAFERYLAHQGTTVLKFFLNISRDEQAERLRARLDDPSKHWKWSASDLAEREFWDEYQQAYERAIAATAQPKAPWFVVPADHKWHARLVVAEAILTALEAVNPQLPEVDAKQQEAIEQAKTELRGSAP